MASVLTERLRVIKGTDKLTPYQWNTLQAKHYFCSVCGIYTHRQRRSTPHEFGLNVACIESVDPLAPGPVALADGAAQNIGAVQGFFT
jgi:hypothetical protein